jgi:hypothetical protein
MEPFKVLTAEWQHDTITFSVAPATIFSFHRQYFIDSTEEIERCRRKTKTVLGATFDAADE